MWFCIHVDVEQICDSHKMLRQKLVVAKCCQTDLCSITKCYGCSVGIRKMCPLGCWAAGLFSVSSLVFPFRDQLRGGRLPWALSGHCVLSGGFVYLVLFVKFFACFGFSWCWRRCNGWSGLGAWCRQISFTVFSVLSLQCPKWLSFSSNIIILVHQI